MKSERITAHRQYKFYTLPWNVWNFINVLYTSQLALVQKTPKISPVGMVLKTISPPLQRLFRKNLELIKSCSIFSLVLVHISPKLKRWRSYRSILTRDRNTWEFIGVTVGFFLKDLAKKWKKKKSQMIEFILTFKNSWTSTFM